MFYTKQGLLRASSYIPTNVKWCRVSIYIFTSHKKTCTAALEELGVINRPTKRPDETVLCV